MQVMVSTALGAVPLTHQAFLLPLASLRAEITRSKVTVYSKCFSQGEHFYGATFYFLS